MSKLRTDSKLFRGCAGVGKPGRKPASPPAATVPAKELESSGGGSQQVDPDLTRALKQIFEVRNCKLKDHSSHSNGSGSSKNGTEESCLRLFGTKVGSPSSSPDGSDGILKNAVAQYARQGTDKLPPAASAHLLKELHKQKLKQRGITATPNDFPDMGEIEFVHTEKRPEMSTLQLINNLHEKRPLEQGLDCAPEAKRPRIEKEKSLDLSLSMKFGSPEEAKDSDSTQGMDIDVEERTGAPVKNPEQLTLFYNGQVLVYDDVPSDKAKAIMVLASSISSRTTSYTPCLAAAAEQAAKAAVTSTPAIPTPLTIAAKASLSMYPSPKGTSPSADKLSSTNGDQARKASISRFLVKRKDKFAKPAMVEKAEASKPAKDSSSRSRSPSPPASRTALTTPQPSSLSSSKGGLVDELKQQIEKCTVKRSTSAPANGAANSSASGTVPAATRQWIGV